MNPDYLPAIGASLRNLCQFAALQDIDDQVLAELAGEIDRARLAVAGARGAARTNRCLRHPGGPVDPDADFGCLLCGAAQLRPARPAPEDFVPGDVLRHIDEHGQDAAIGRYGPRAVARAVNLGRRHPSTKQLPAIPVGSHDEGDN